MNYKDLLYFVLSTFLSCVWIGYTLAPQQRRPFYHDLLYLFLAFPFSRTGYQDSTECKTGTGISDIIFIPDDPDKPGFILEVKRLSLSTSTGGESTPTKHPVTATPSPPSGTPNGWPVAPSMSPTSIQLGSDQGDQAKHPMAMRPRPAKASGDQGRIPKCSIPAGPDKPSIPTKRSKLLLKVAAVSKPKKTIFEQPKDLSERGNRYGSMTATISVICLVNAPRWWWWSRSSMARNITWTVLPTTTSKRGRIQVAAWWQRSAENRGGMVQAQQRRRAR